MEFKAELSPEGIAVVKPIIEKVGKDVIVHVPSFKLMEKLKRDIGKGDGSIKYVNAIK